MNPMLGTWPAAEGGAGGGGEECVGPLSHVGRRGEERAMSTGEPVGGGGGGAGMGLGLEELGLRC